MELSFSMPLEKQIEQLEFEFMRKMKARERNKINLFMFGLAGLLYSTAGIALVNLYQEKVDPCFLEIKEYGLIERFYPPAKNWPILLY